MSTTKEELIAQATQAGRQVGSAAQMIRDAIRAAYATGAVSFNDATIKDMRAAFCDACDSAGKSKQSGNVMFARAWDDLIAEGLALEPRPRKGVGRNAKKDKDESPETEGEEETKVPKVDKAEIARDLLKRAKITPELVKNAIAAFVALEALVKAKGPHTDAVKDARHVLKACGNGINLLLAAAGQEVTKDEAEATAAAVQPAPKAAAPKAPKPAAKQKVSA